MSETNDVTFRYEDLVTLHSYLDQAYAFLLRLEELQSVLDLKKTVSYSPLTLKIEQGVKFAKELMNNNKPPSLKVPRKRAPRKTAAKAVETIAEAVSNS